MSGDYTGLRLAARAGEPETEPETQPEDENESSPDGGKKKEDYMDKEEHEAAVAQAKADAFAEANQRVATVIASEHYAGRETLAQNLLGNAGMTAEQIIGALAAAPAPTPSASDEDAAEAAARDEMNRALAETGNSNIDANGGGKPKGQDQNATAVWDQAIQANNPGLKLG